jgi:23S rRNA (cytosine1962-C5)-methyltransferase
LLHGIIGAQAGWERLILRLSRNIETAASLFGFKDSNVLFGEPLHGAVLFLETGIRFEADVLRGQKTGFFLDQRENRREVEKLAANRKVLNAFSFSGGFSLYAARGGAKSVMDLDLSPHALESANRNFALNIADKRVAACKHEVVQADAFEWLAASGERFDLIILDPPSLAKREVERARAVAAYGKLTSDAIRRLNKKGILVSNSCSAHVSAEEFFSRIELSARQSGRRFSVLNKTTEAPDHPANFAEAHYLKCIYLEFLD